MWGGCCTIFNRKLDERSRLELFEPTRLEGVCWQGGGAVRDRKDPREGNVEVYIPFTVQSSRAYAPPRAYAAAPGGRWTLREGDLLMRGTYEGGACGGKELLAGRDGVFTIVSVSENGFGSRELRHWEVCAR